MKQDYFAMLKDESLKPLGVCASYAEADEKAPDETVMVFSRFGLNRLINQINQVLDV